MAKELTKAERLTELTPLGGRLNYLLSDEGRVYASAQSWSRALQVPDPMVKWFESGLARVALLKKDSAGGSLEMTFSNTSVYRWHAVAEQLRAFDREFHNTGYKSRPLDERRQLEKFHENYDRLTNWGYDLQERAIAASLNARTANSPSTAISQNALIEVIRQAIAPRLHEHDGKLKEHDVILKEIKEAVPALRDQSEFISVKQAIQEKGLDSTVMPLYPSSRENLSGLVGQNLATKGAERGQPVVSRIDGTATSAQMNTYRRGAIFAALDEVMDQSTKQGALPL